MPQTQLVVTLRFLVDQMIQTKALHEPLQFALGHRALGEIHEVRLDAAFREEPLRLSGVCAFLDPEDLDFHVARFQ